MSIAELFKRAFVRRLAYIAAAILLAALGMGRAHAAVAVPEGCRATPTVSCDDKAKAKEYAGRFADDNCARWAQQNNHICVESRAVLRVQLRPNDPYAGQLIYDSRYKSATNPNAAPFVLQGNQWVAYYPCPVGKWWNETLNQCDEPCESRNASLGGVNQPIKWATSNAAQCIAECKYQIVSDQQTRAVYAGGPGATPVQTGTLYGGIWEYTGEKCTVPPIKPKEEEKPKSECVPAGSGQTYCIRDDGQYCATSTSGRSICWAPGEQGEKTDGPITQESKQGQASPNPPEGSSHQSTTVVNNTTSNVTTTTTINNYSTNSGAPAGSSNQGSTNNSDGTPGTSGGGNGTGTGTGNGDDDGDENGSTGGGTCGSPPVNSGDPLLSQIAMQTWSTRCAIEDRNKAQDDAANAMAGDSDGLENVSEDDIFSEEPAIDVSKISETLLGGGGGQCSFGASLSLMGKEIDLPPGFWELASWIGMIVVAAAYFWIVQEMGK